MNDAVLRVQSQLTDRDHILLGWLHDHGVLTSFQIAHALYPSIDFAQKRLRKLVAIAVLARFRPHKPDGGSYPYHYVLDQLGVDVVSAQRGDELPRRDQARKRRWHLTNRANLPHLLATNQFFTDLAGHARIHPDTGLLRWWPAARCQQTGAFAVDGDDMQVRAYTAPVRPDGHGIWRERHTTVPFFAEVDRSTEPLWKLVGKLDGYAALAHATRRVWPVLFWLESPLRERHLHQALTDARASYPVATSVRGDPAMTGRSPADQVWWLHHRDGGPLRLADLPHTITDGYGQAA
ncbi:replication-relaxation family protein [Dactylosporangium sp. CA-092794]|uniref:replication-relaxation family protein n=1 Tax=Dactylosporangium sp. CA-092794 TaxID=3239929 RepID=UPI003D8D9195